MAARKLRTAFALAWACLGVGAASASTESVATFSAMRRAIEADYAYPAKLPAWRRRIGRWESVARDESQLRVALEGAIDELRDDDAALLPLALPRRVPAHTDLHAVIVPEGARVDAVRVASEADVAGLRPGQVITHIQGVPVARAIAERLSDDRATAQDRQWALAHLMAGPRSGRFRLEVRDEPREVTVERGAFPEPAGFLAHAIGEHRDIGYVRPGFRARGTRERTWTQGLREQKGVRAMILDLRGSDGPASRAETIEMLSAFAHASGPWQQRRDRHGRVDTDTVVPAPWALRMPLVLLVDRWTAGEGEALAAGLHAVAGAALIGTPMAGLQGESREVPLGRSGLVLRFPAQRAFTPAGVAREKLLPDVAVDLAAPSGGPGDPILYQALKRLER